ncbi:MAG TPA: RNA methyltransferase [Gemmatimonadaceae bacterium]|nr:RNA methyltransferase [Gemmatimonadaceae bacterium]
MRLLTLARDLQRRKGRERRSLFVAEGVRAVEEVARSAAGIRGAISSPELEETPRGRALLGELGSRADELLRVTVAEMAQVAGTESPQGVIAIAEIPERSLDDVTAGAGARLLVLDGVQDPGNVGTIIRTAAALDAVAVVALPGTVDLWNAKVVRGAMGAHLRITAVESGTDDLLSWAEREQVELWLADAAGEPLHAAQVPSRLGIVLGNEGAGVSGRVRAHATRAIGLPLAAGIESLNVAVAAGIMLYALSARRGPS